MSHTLSLPACLLLPSGRGATFLMIIFKKCQASAHLQIIVSNLHTRSRRPQLPIWKMEHSINKINGLGQLTATVAAADPQAQCARTTEEVCQSGNLFRSWRWRSRMCVHARTQTRRQSLLGNRPSGSPCTVLAWPLSPQWRRGEARCSRRPPVLKDHRQKEGLCLQAVGGRLKASLLELDDIVREPLLEGGGWGPFRSSHLVLRGPAILGQWSRPARRGQRYLGTQEVLAPSQLQKQLSWQLATRSCPPLSPLLSLTHESPRLTHTLSGHRPSITAMPSRAVAGGSSFLSARLRKQGAGDGCCSGINIMRCAHLLQLVNGLAMWGMLLGPSVLGLMI